MAGPAGAPRRRTASGSSRQEKRSAPTTTPVRSRGAPSRRRRRRRRRGSAGPEPHRTSRTPAPVRESVPSAGRPRAAVDVDRGAGDEAGTGTGEEDGGRGDIVDMAGSTDRRRRDGIAFQRSDARRRDEVGSDAV